MHRPCNLERPEVQKMTNVGASKKVLRPPQDKHLVYCLVKEQSRQISPLRISTWEGFLSQERCHKLASRGQAHSPFFHPGMWTEGTFHHQGKKKIPFLWNLGLHREADFPMESPNTVFFPERKKKWIKLPIFKDMVGLIHGSKEFCMPVSLCTGC